MKFASPALVSLAALSLSACAAYSGPVESQPAAAAEAPQADANAAFEKLGADYIEVLTELNPVAATGLGEYRYNALMPDISERGRRTSHNADLAFLAALETIPFDELSRANQVDYSLLKTQLEYDVWSHDVEQQWAWNPQRYHGTASSALYGMVARDFAPFEERLPDIIARMEAIPAFLETARAQIVVARVPKVHAETVAKQNAGIMSIVNGLIDPEVEKAGLANERYNAAKAGLEAALTEHQTWLDETVVPGAQGEFRLGLEKYQQKMAFALHTDMSVTELKSRAEAAYAETRAQMFEVAREIEPCGDLQTRDPAMLEQAVIECGLEKSYENRAPRDGLEQAARDTTDFATAYTYERNLVRPMDGPVQIITMPEAFWGNSVAYLDAPGPLDKSLPAFYAVAPIPDSWSESQATSFLKEYNNSLLHILSIHEGVPGHALQLDHANKYDSVLRAVLSSGPFIEGWAVYSERMIAEDGYLGGMETTEGKYFILNGLKFRLRAIINTLLDIKIHTDGMEREEAMTLMMEGGFQQEREAAGKWVRANLGSIQLLSYYTGYDQHWSLRQEAEERWGEDFDLREYHDRVLSFGSPPVKYARALLFELPVE
ncbi:DUF885 domain-containing protein [Altererythrobacter lutimaris]|uniref:DUF885 domain-containing protein n=1 Tax=Altererythrobacter lutimaris TaxID=2743979 RepID=A0A850HDN0_9SPHN|nr:DUF885 domain-containing protein [Altererythrobacter lutimaris]NVE94858.1 DUF885 domain-containing protein [Altererythrobacter lutimaris]